MIEKAPKHIKDDDTIKVMVDLESKGLLKTFQDDYLYWDNIKYKSKDHPPEKVWNAVKLHRWLRQTTIKFGKYQFSFVITDYMQRVLHQFDLHIGGNLSSNIGIAETDKTKFVISSIMEEAISSSQMEGANTTRKKAKEMIQKEQKPTNKSEQMILNNFITMKHIVQHKNQSVTPNRILALHQLIIKDTLNKKVEEGKFRDTNDVYVVDHSSSEVVHQPPSHQELELLINDLCEFCNKESENFIHPIVKGCIIHFMIGWIHPFVDGNGRTARALFYWYMLKQGYWLTEYLSISRIIKDSKAQYEKAYLYSEIDENDLSYFINYHIKTLEKAIEALKQYINTKQKEVFQAAQFMSIPGVNDRMAQIIKLIHDDPERILNVKEIESRFSISNFTARSDLKSLVEFGFLQVIQVNKKKQNFIRANKFDDLLKKYLLN
jgi:Fic family protein